MLIYSSLKTEMVDEVLECEDGYFLKKKGRAASSIPISISGKTGWSIVGVTDMAEAYEGASEEHSGCMLLSQQDFWVVTVLLCVSILLSDYASAGTAEKKKFHERGRARGNFEGTQVGDGGK